MSFESKQTGLFKDKKDNKKVRKSTDIIPDVAKHYYLTNNRVIQSSHYLSLIRSLIHSLI